MQFGGRVVRAYRPSSMGGDEYDEGFGRERDEKVKLYAMRAQMGLPLFEDDPDLPLSGAPARYPKAAS